MSSSTVVTQALHESEFALTKDTTYLALVSELWESARKHDDVIKGKHFPRYWPFVWGIHRSPMSPPDKGQ